MWYHNANETRRLHLEISNYCNAFCPGCPREQENQKDYINNAKLSLQFMKDNFTYEKYPELNHVDMCGCNGDAATNMELYEICAYFISEWRGKVCVYVNSNGGVRTTKFWEDLGKLFVKQGQMAVHNWGGHPSRVIFAIDGLEDTNDIYRIGVKWNKLQENFRAYINAGGVAHWQFISFPHNEHLLEDVKKRAVEEGFLKFDMFKDRWKDE